MAQPYYQQPPSSSDTHQYHPRQSRHTSRDGYAHSTDATSPQLSHLQHPTTLQQSSRHTSRDRLTADYSLANKDGTKSHRNSIVLHRAKSPPLPPSTQQRHHSHDNTYDSHAHARSNVTNATHRAPSPSPSVNQRSPQPAIASINVLPFRSSRSNSNSDLHSTALLGNGQTSPHTAPLAHPTTVSSNGNHLHTHLDDTFDYDKYQKQDNKSWRALVQRCRAIVQQCYQLCLTTIQNNNLLRQTKARYKDLHHETREKLWFTISSFLGTVLFLILFDGISQFIQYSVEDNAGGQDTSFALAYTLSYLTSIVWQHALHRLLLTQHMLKHTSYWYSLLQTYAVYSLSLIAVSLLGTAAVTYLHVSGTVVAMTSIPVAGVINYYSLQHCHELLRCIDIVGMSERGEATAGLLPTVHNSNTTSSSNANSTPHNTHQQHSSDGGGTAASKQPRSSVFKPYAKLQQQKTLVL